MTFTYTLPFNDISRVRFNTGQTVSGETFMSDEEINAVITEAGGWQGAVIASLKFIIMRLSQPNFKADWLQVDNETARKGYEAMLADKINELGISSVSAEAVHVYRADSGLIEEPDFSAGRPGSVDSGTQW